MKQILFVIPTYNRVDIIRKTLKANAEIVNRYECVKLIVIDNDSQDDTFRVLSEEYGKDSNVNILKNEQNIGFKGQINRITSEHYFREKLCIVLSDEDVIFEPGLISFIESSSYNELILNSLYIFNILNVKGKDSFFRRKKRKIKSINEIEIFGFGYISGFAFYLKKNFEFEGNSILKSENSYPHLFPAFFRKLNIEVVGEAIVSNFINDKQSFLSEEWASRRHHFHPESVNDFLVFLKKEFQLGWLEFIKFSFTYRAVAGLYRNVGQKRYLTAGMYFCSLLLFNPKFAFYYLIRYLN